MVYKLTVMFVMSSMDTCMQRDCTIVLVNCCLIRRYGWLLVFIMAFNTPANAGVLTVAISNAEFVDPVDTKYYYEKLLTLALEKTRPTDGDFVIVHKPNNGGANRDRAMLTASIGIDITWGSATKERMQTMHTIPVDILKSLNNYRVLLINKNEQTLFNTVKTLADLQNLIAGGGSQWTDTAILKANSITVRSAIDYQGLIKMLAAHRFHFMSRGLYEVEYDLMSHSQLGLVVERNLLLVYSTPLKFCFFVNKNNIALADRIERGLKIAQQDGSFDNLFYSMPSLKKGLELLKNTRINITLQNSHSDGGN